MGFQAIAGSGHCGTMWLAQVLNCVPGQWWGHEIRTKATVLSWPAADAYPPDSEVFDYYWKVIRQEMGRYAVVGDSNSWSPELLPAVNKVIPIERVIYLTRDKESQLYSLLHKSPVWSNPPYSGVAQKRLELYGRIAGRPLDVGLLVDANDFMPDWLRQQGLTVDVYSLESLTTDYQAFKELTKLPDGQFDIWRHRRVNQKVFA
jgi:hypothetical protein